MKKSGKKVAKKEEGFSELESESKSSQDWAR